MYVDILGLSFLETLNLWGLVANRDQVVSQLFCCVCTLFWHNGLTIGGKNYSLGGLTDVDTSACLLGSHHFIVAREEHVLQAIDGDPVLAHAARVVPAAEDPLHLPM